MPIYFNILKFHRFDRVLNDTCKLYKAKRNFANWQILLSMNLSHLYTETPNSTRQPQDHPEYPGTYIEYV